MATCMNSSKRTLEQPSLADPLLLFFFNNIMLDKAKTREADGVVDVFVVDTVVHHILVNFWRGAQSLSLTHRYSRFLSAQCGIV